jgi:REP element-mobilizing transposase RayT
MARYYLFCINVYILISIDLFMISEYDPYGVLAKGRNFLRLLGLAKQRGNQQRFWSIWKNSYYSWLARQVQSSILYTN